MTGCPECQHLQDEGAVPIPTPPIIADNMLLCLSCFQVWRAEVGEDEDDA